MTEPIDWAAAVVKLRWRYFVHRVAVKSGDRTAARVAAIREDADTLACIIEESEAAKDGSWSKLHDDLMRLVVRCSN